MSTRGRRGRRGGPLVQGPPRDPDAVTPALREDMLPISMGAVVLGFIAIAISAMRGTMMLYGDAVAHLGIARRIVDTKYPGLAQLGGVWLPLPHLLMTPFIWKMEWWQDGMAGAWPSLICYVVGVLGFYRLARRVLVPRWALVATAFLAMNANLLYLTSTAMTEPLFLALMIWITLVTLECVEAIEAARPLGAGRRMLGLGVLIFCAVMTRYDGWVLGAAVWCVIAWTLWKEPAMRAKLAGVFVGFTLITVAGPLSWFAYNHVYGHDWLDFMRGPYSAKEIDRKTSPPGSHHYFGWHDPAWSLMLYARTAQVDAAAWETGWLVAAASLAGLWLTIKSKVRWSALLLWMPLPFYVYSISYGSVPIFIPQLYPHSYYNSRYGMEMLPCFALFGAVGLSALAVWLKPRQPLVVRFMQPVMLMLIVLNTIWMLHKTPLVLKEAQVNSMGRISLETALANQLVTFAPGAPIMMETGSFVGALQKAGIPLKQTLTPSDYYKGLTTPAEKAAYVISFAGDDVAKAVTAHPEGLTEMTILCSTGQPCARVYRSDRFLGAGNRP
ncbi:ArnT family glycosyltransferase [Granulicella tundricola]|uniref:Uncharacterized protein n=1 Tax=Granulicella tundricola (strain ATCC BAA-1859 / DSM 23138 / MP5ACTX9) TaxID=1198114 RepID=E8WYD7_GRATM|nr:glycosyltransferase family 39 protein [Granulicella tundricola]ADW69843.1 hypothetical protein AciX9_2820 [Granulicella tundricola MP5ACTX9]